MFVLLAANSMFAQIPSEEGFGNHSPEIMEPYTRGAGVYYKDGKSGIRNYDGTDITEPIFDKSYLNSSLGIIDMKGKMILPASYDKIENLTRHFSKGFEGYYKVTIDKKSGIVDTNNTIIIPIEYDYLYDFEDKFFIVKKDTLFGLFAKNGDLIHGLKFDYIERGRNDKCVVYLTHKDGLVGVINNKGEEIYTPQFKKVSKVPDGDLDIRFVERYEKNYYLVFTIQYGKSGLFNLYTGKFDLELEYDNICQQLNKRYFSAKKNGKFGVVSYENKVLIDFIYDTISFYHTFVIDEEEMEEAGFVASLNGAYGALNLKNKTLIPFIYKELKKLGYNNVYKAKKNSNYVLVDQNNTVLNKDPFDDIADYEQFLQRDGRNYYYKTLSFNNGKMREMDGKGKFLTNSINMSPHEGFTSFLELKLELIKALNNESDSALYYYGKKIAPSPHLVSLIDKSAKRLYENSQYLNYDDIYSRYFYKLLEFKRYYWNGSYFDKDNLMTEDFTIRKKGIVTNKRLKDYAYGDSHYLDKILRNAIKINGYWISSYYLSRYY